jgi:hypothetical protein
MKTSFEHIILKTQLSESESFGSRYDELLDSPEVPVTPYTDHLLEDVAELYSSILLTYSELTEFQETILLKIFKEFNNIRLNIDPNRLKEFSHYFNSDGELLLFRNTDLGLINIIINPEDCAAFSFIPNDKGQNRRFYFVDQDGDFEILAYDFLSYKENI